MLHQSRHQGNFSIEHAQKKKPAEMEHTLLTSREEQNP
jgi:hypothetical protein